MSAQKLFEFCESELFPETLQNSEVGSSSNCCYEEHSSSHSMDHLSYVRDMNKFNNTVDQNEKFTTNPNSNNNVVTVTATTATTTTTVNSDNSGLPTTTGPTTNNNNLSIFFDTFMEFNPNEVNYSVSPQFFLDGQFDISLLNGQQQQQPPVADGGSDCSQMAPPQLHQYPPAAADQPAVQLMEECLSYMPSCPYLDATTIGNFYSPGNLKVPLPAENSVVFTGGGMFELQHQDHQMDFQGDNGRFFCPENMQRVYNFCNDLQAGSSESQHMVVSGGNSTLASDITSLEDSTFKVGKLSVEQRKEKINRYMEKRNVRNFTKKIKYACRKTLADSRPRVRGRFAKNDEFGEKSRTCLGTPENDANNTEDLSVSFLYNPNTAAAALTHHNGRNIFAANNCFPAAATNPYGNCPPLYCTDHGQMRQ